MIVESRTKSSRTQMDIPSAILAGGIGSRLREVLGTTPKSLAPVGGRPFLDYQLSWLSSSGIRDVVLCVGYKRAEVQKFAACGQQWELNIRYAVEQQALGTAGALKNAEALIAKYPLLVLNGDSLLEIDLSAFVEFHEQHHAIATLGLARVAASSRYGSVLLDCKNRILSFTEKNTTAMESANTLQLINGGVYLFSREIMDMIPAHKSVSLESEIFPRLSGKRIFGYTNTGYFIDIGVPEDFEKAQRELPLLKI